MKIPRAASTACATGPDIAPPAGATHARVALPRGPLLRQRSAPLAWLMLLLFLLGCDRRGPEPDGQPLPRGETRIARWSASDRGPIAAIEDDRLRRDLASAIADARRTAPTARQRWIATPPDQRDRWAIKWAAPIRRGEGAGLSEHVWVEPLAWTPDRIEGILLNQPRRAIGFEAGDIVTVPPDELSDWLESSALPAAACLEELMRLSPAHPAPPGHAGGFTVLVLRRWLATLPS